MDNHINEDAPKGWKGTVRAMLLHHPELDQGEDKNPYALANWMKKRGDEAHYKDQKSTLKGEPHKKKKYKDKKEHRTFPTFAEYCALREATGGSQGS